MDLRLSLVLAMSTLIIAVVMAFVPALFNRTTPLGVSVPRSKVDDGVVKQAVRRYRGIVLAIGAVAAALMFLGDTFPIITMLAPLLVLSGGVIAYTTQRKKIIAAKQEHGWYDEAEVSIAGHIASLTHSSTNTDAQQQELMRAIDSIDKPRVPVMWLLCSLLAVVLGAAVVASKWLEIPARIVTHWGPGLEPDAWADKSVGSVFVPTWLGLSTLASFAGITFAIARAPEAARNDRSIKGQLGTRAMMVATNRGLGFLGFILAFGFATMQVVNYVPGYEAWIHSTTIGFLVLTIFGSLFMLVPLATATSRVDDALRGLRLPDDHTDSPDNDKHYKWGMFYYNPDDPAVMVEKRFGVGMDFNYATWQGKMFILAILMILIGSFVAMFAA